jgi:integrase
MMLEQRIKEANGRLKNSYCGLKIEKIGGRLYLRGTLPPKSPSGSNKPYRQRISAANANQEGIKIAERLAKRISVQIDAKTFDWADYQEETDPDQSNVKTLSNWINEFENDYFLRKERTFKTQTTWRVEYRGVFKFLPLEHELTIENLKSTIINHSKPDTRTRKRFCQTLNLLAKFAGLNCDFSSLVGNYSYSSREPRNLPTDKQIQDFYYQIGNHSWQWIYGMIATYGLRNHEVFFIDLNSLTSPEHSIKVTQGKTGSRKVWPLHPEWVVTFNLTKPQCPNINLNRPNTAIGNVVTRHFRRNERMPFKVYDLRHAWAVRSLEYGIDISLAAKQMGHSLQVHSSLYHSWINDQAHQRAFELAINKSDRPLPPD